MEKNNQLLSKLGYLVLLILAVPLGVLAGIVGFFGLAYLTDSIPAMLLAGALFLIFVVAWLSGKAFRGLLAAGHPLRQWLPLLTAGITVAIVSLAAHSLVLTPMMVTYQPMQPTPETRYWTLPTGSRLAYSLTPAHPAAGEPAPSPVILLHGGPGGPGLLTDIRYIQQIAAAGFDVYHYHQVGAGLSDRLEDVTDYTVDRHVADLEAIRQKIGAEQIILVGGSWGGTLAAHYLAAYPDRVEKAVLSSPGAIWPPAFDNGNTSAGPEEEIITEAFTLRFAVVFALQQINPRAAHNLASDKEMSGFFQPLIGRIIASDVAGCGADGDFVAPPEEPQIPLGFSYYTNMLTSADLHRSNDPRPALRHVDVPILILRGECDRLRWEVSHEYQEVFPNASLLIVEGAGHSVAAAPHYGEILQSFLTEQP